MKGIIFNVVLFYTCIYPHANQAIQGFGFYEGFKHPIQGLDHLLAMLCVGMISARLGGKAIWYVPTCFVVVMALGCVIGFFGTSLQFIEPLISISIIIFGAMLISPQLLTPLLTLLTVGLFAIVHGYAHGKEMPLFVLPEIYIFGFMVATTLIHGLGVGVGELINRFRFSVTLYRITGLGLAVSGIYFILT